MTRLPKDLEPADEEAMARVANVLGGGGAARALSDAHQRRARGENVGCYLSRSLNVWFVIPEPPK